MRKLFSWFFPFYMCCRFKPGDIIVLESGRDMSIATLDRLKKSFEGVHEKTGVQIIVIPYPLKVASARRSTSERD